MSLDQLMVTLPHVAFMILSHLDPATVCNFFKAFPNLAMEMKNDLNYCELYACVRRNLGYQINEMLMTVIDDTISYHIGRLITSQFPCVENHPSLVAG